jgi:hypothetical protein
MEKKHHFRAVFKSDHLGSADLEEFIEEKKSLIFTIKEVKQYKGVESNGKMVGRVSVAGKEIDANIAYFVEPIKPMVLNATNSKIIQSFCNNSPFVEDWKNVLIELYIDPAVKMKKEVVSGVRIKQIQPKPKAKPQFTEANFEKAHNANASIETIKKAYEITTEIETKYNEYRKSKG